MDAVTLARACADAMWTDDATSQGLGIKLVAVEPGQAVLAMTVSETMVNWHDTCHGGFIYLLADTAFGYACNSRNQRMVAQYCSISYLNPAQRGERLTAHAVERQLQGRSGIYDVAVKRADGAVIAEFRGHARAIAGNIVADAK
jgi:acyl-CoA thioesterase